MSDVGNTDKRMSSTELPDHLDQTRLEDWVTKLNKVLLSTESELEEVVERDQFQRVPLTVNQPTGLTN